MITFINIFIKAYISYKWASRGSLLLHIKWGFLIISVYTIHSPQICLGLVIFGWKYTRAIKLSPNCTQWSQLVDIVQQQIQCRKSIQKPGFWLSSRPFCIRITFIWVHQGPPVIVLIFFSFIGYYIEFSNMESKPNFGKVHGP